MYFRNPVLLTLNGAHDNFDLNFKLLSPCFLGGVSMTTDLATNEPATAAATGKVVLYRNATMW